MKHKRCYTYRDPIYDAFACQNHNVWLEEKCSDSECEMCSNRPERPR